MRDLEQVRVYGARAALLMEEVSTAAGVPSVNLEAAPTVGGRADWSAKTVVQVTARELPEVVAVLHGWRHEFEALYHGPAKNRGYRFRHEPDGAFTVAVFDPRGRRAVRVGLGERLGMATLALRRLALSYPGVTLWQLHTTLRGLCFPACLADRPSGD